MRATAALTLAGIAAWAPDMVTIPFESWLCCGAVKMAWTSLREHIEEMARLNRLVGTGLGALARSEATNAEIERREQIVGGLVKRCRWVEAMRTT